MFRYLDEHRSWLNNIFNLCLNFGGGGLNRIFKPDRLGMMVSLLICRNWSSLGMAEHKIRLEMDL